MPGSGGEQAARASTAGRSGRSALADHSQDLQDELRIAAVGVEPPAAGGPPRHSSASRWASSRQLLHLEHLGGEPPQVLDEHQRSMIGMAHTSPIESGATAWKRRMNSTIVPWSRTLSVWVTSSRARRWIRGSPVESLGSSRK